MTKRSRCRERTGVGSFHGARMLAACLHPKVLPAFACAAVLGMATFTTAASMKANQPAGDVAELEQGAPLLAQNPSDFRSVVQFAKDQVFPAVVYIRCLRESNESGKSITSAVTGSGVIMSPEGRVLTNWHVIDKAVEIRCLLSDGRAMHAELVGSDQSVDLAVIQLVAEPADLPLPYATGGSSDDLVEGDFVMAMGAPWGLNRSVSIGIVSCVRRYLPEVSEYSHWIQTDAAINPGNSGGPLVNTAGEVVGLNTRGMAFGDNVGFAVPYDTIKHLVPHLVESGEVPWSWTGLRLQPLRDFDLDTVFEGDSGVIVAETESGSPAREAGLQPRDRIVSVNDEPVNAISAESLPDVRRTLGFLVPDEPVRLTVYRGAERMTVEMTPRMKGTIEGEELDCPRWDLAVKEINQFDNEDLFFYKDEGVFIFATEFPGNASMSGLQEQDILLQIAGEDVNSLEDVERVYQRTIETIKDEPRLMVRVMRGGLIRQVVMDISRDHDRD